MASLLDKDAILTAVYLSWTYFTYLTTKFEFLRELSSSGKTVNEETANASSSWWLQHSTVPKHWFLHFYVTGILASIVTLYAFPGTWNIPCVAPMLLQMTRRCYECLYVHVWNTESKMFVPAYAVGLLHYAILPLNFVLLSDEDEIQLVYHQYHYDEVHAGLCIAGIVLCLYAQYEQHVHHCILAQLRRRQNNPHGIRYLLPQGRWFQYVGSPQNLAEIFIYLGFVCILQSTPSICLFTWVFSNQVVTALRTHEWYQQHYDEYKKQQRKALVPFVF